MTQSNLQQDYIRKIESVGINPLQCANHYFNSKIKKFVPGKRYSLDRYSIKDYLTVASNQIVFELDAKTYSTNYEISKKIIGVLEERELPYYIFSSGGKGIHIEVWFNKPENTTKEYRELFTEALSYDLSFKHIRFWLWNKILDEAHINNELRGVGKIIDSACMSFDDLNHKTRLLRVCGGRKIYTDKISEKEEIYYKTHILKEDFNKVRIKHKDFNKVLYPSILEAYKLNISEFSEFLQKFVTDASESKQYKFKRIDLSKNKGYLGLDSVQRVLEGLPAGQRSSGAQILAIAMANDKIDTVQQEKIIQKYVDNCSQIGDSFTIGEAMGWMKWVSSQPELFWNCSLVRQINVHNSDLCNYCKQAHREANKLLTQSTILDQIETLLNIEIKGELETKMLIFLLVLSKDFPSKTGEPGWNIQGDPMSQNIILSSESSSGKTWITKKILDLLGEREKDYFIVSRYTKSVLNYYTEINMDGRVVFIEELQGIDENTNQLRVWMSEGELNLESVEKVRNEEGLEVNAKVRRTTKGQPVFITNQAEGVVEDQLNNRSWVLSTDTSMAQTKHILNYQDEINKGDIIDLEEKKRIVQDALKQLKPYHFIIPYSDNEILNIPISDVRSRRDYNKFMTLIKCSAYLHQKQRTIAKKNNKEFIICNLKDYDIAKKYSSSILGATFSGLTVQQIDIINFIRNSVWKEEFNVNDLMRGLGKTQPYWLGQLSQLGDLGYIVADKQGLGKTTIYTLNEEKALNLISLPMSKDLEEEYKKQLLSIKERGYEILKSTFIGEEPDLNTKLEKPTYNEQPITEPITTRAEFINPINDKIAIPNLPGKNLNSEFIGKMQNSIQNSKPQPINNARGNNFINLNASKNGGMGNPHGLVIGSKKVLDYIKNQNNHLLKTQNVIDSFGAENSKEVDIIIKKLISEGEIYEPKSGHIMLL